MDVLINSAVIMLVLALAWQVAKHGAKKLAHVIALGAVTALIAPGAYAAAKAEASLSARDLSLDYNGNTTDAAKFNAIVQDRLRRTRTAATHPQNVWTATQIGRRFASA